MGRGSSSVYRGARRPWGLAGGGELGAALQEGLHPALTGRRRPVAGPPHTTAAAGAALPSAGSDASNTHSAGTSVPLYLSRGRNPVAQARARPVSFRPAR